VLKGLLTFGLTRRPIVLLALLVFLSAGLLAFSRLNIEAYPDPAPVMLEITAQSAGLSAEEMERYYTIPIEVGLAATPGVDVIRSTSFYGLSFVRVVFQYGVYYYFAVTQTAINLQQNVNLPNDVQATIQGTSLVGEIYRYQVVGPPHFGLTNLRTVQDWILQRRLLTVPGVVQVNTWGGTTKQYDVDVDLDKLDAYNVTLPQVISAVGNANVNVGGRTINIGQQSVSVRGVGLMDSGGSIDLTQGYKVEDIENVPLSQTNGVPVFVKDVATVSIGHVPRLGKAGRDKEDDVVAAIVIMNRTLHTNDVVARVRAEINKINSDGTLPPGVKLVPFYDRTTLVAVTTSTVLHNLIFGCLLIFFIQWIFLGDLRSAIIVGANIPFALFFTIIFLVLRNEDANLLSVGAVDFGIIVDAAVILVENIYRSFQAPPEERQVLLRQLEEGRWGADPTRATDSSGGQPWTDRLRLILISALQIDRAVLFLHRNYRGGLHSPVHHVGCRRPDLRPDGTNICVRFGRSSNRDVHRYSVPGVHSATRAPPRSRNDCGARVTLDLHAGAAVVAQESEDHCGHRTGVYARKLVGVLALGSSKIKTGGFSPPGWTYRNSCGPERSPGCGAELSRAQACATQR
jgi:heavy metal efflux system protein